MTNPMNPFAFGAQERSHNYWADRLDPVKEAERKAKQDAMEAEQRRMIAAHQEQQRAQAIMTHAGNCGACRHDPQVRRTEQTGRNERRRA